MAALQRMSRFTLAVTLLFFGLNGCARRAPKDAPRYSEGLIVCPGGQQMDWAKSNGIDQLRYQISLEYPANSIISCISSGLAEKGWLPLQEDYWNPGLPSSHVRGWTNFRDATVHPEATVDSWYAQWVNNEGDIIFYALRYQYPPGDRHNLTVLAGFIPANIAKNMPKNQKPQK
jgi:hypothetical protein